MPICVSTVLLLSAYPCASIIPEAFVFTKLSTSPVVVSLTTIYASEPVLVITPVSCVTAKSLCSIPPP